MKTRDQDQDEDEEDACSVFLNNDRYPLRSERCRCPGRKLTGHRCKPTRATEIFPLQAGRPSFRADWHSGQITNPPLLRSHPLACRDWVDVA
jgi:hypothetical protein